MNTYTKKYLKYCWDINKFNVRKATEAALTHSPVRLHIAVELLSTIFTDKPDITHADALDVLTYISQCNHFNMIMLTFADNSFIGSQGNLFQSHDIVFKGVNKNIYANHQLPSMKPYYDLLIDSKAGFNGTKDWSLIWYLLRISEQFINEKSPLIKRPAIDPLAVHKTERFYGPQSDRLMLKQPKIVYPDGFLKNKHKV